MNNIQEQDGGLLSSDLVAPKWLSIAFKFYGASFLLVVVFSIAMGFVSDKSELQISLATIFLIASGAVLMSFIVAYGCWKLKRWVIPILGLQAISGFYFLFSKDLTISATSSSVIGIIFFGIAIYYRRYFSGPYRPRYMHGLYLFGILLMTIPIIFPLISPTSSDVSSEIKPEVESAYTLSDIKQYIVGLELFYVDYNRYPENLSILEPSGYIYFPPSSIPDIHKEIDYCVSNDKQNYAMGVLILDSFGNIMEESVSQIDLPCKLSNKEICKENDYYCKIPGITVDSEESES